jgi:hypothetical protein
MQALARSATTEAAAQLRKGLDALDGLPDGAGRRQLELDLQLALGSALTATKGYSSTEVGEAYARARALAEQAEQINRPEYLWGVFYLCEPDWGPIYAGYLALALHASLLVAIGLLMSSLTENQVIAAALSMGTFVMLWFADSVSYLLSPPFDSLAINLSLIGHFRPMVSGSVFLSDIGYFVTASMLALFLTTWGLAQR